LGVGEKHATLAGDCCPIIVNQAHGTPLEFNHLYRDMSGTTSPVYGIAGGLSGLFSRLPAGEALFELEKQILNHLPFTGENASAQLDATVHPLARGGIMNALAAGGLIVIGHYGGDAISACEKRHAEEQARASGASEEDIAVAREGAGLAGRVVKHGAQAAACTIVFPAIAPGIGHAVMFLSAILKDIPKVGEHLPFLDTMNYNAKTGSGIGTKIAAVLGKNPGNCKREGKLYDALQGAGGAFASQLCCTLPALIGALPTLLTHANHRASDLPEGVRPYDGAAHPKMPDIAVLSTLPDREIDQRIRDNQYHIDDTEAAQQRNGGIRQVAKIGASVAAGVGIAALGVRLINKAHGNSAMQQALGAIPVNEHGRPTTDGGQWHSMMNATDGTRYVGGKFGEAFDAGAADVINNPIAPTPIEGMSPLGVPHPDNPIVVMIQKATCAFNGQQPQAGKVCDGFEKLCCAAPYINWKAVQPIVRAAEGLAGGGVARNQSVMIGGASVALGSVIYYGMRQLLDAPADAKIHALKHEKMALESIKAARAGVASRSFEERIAQGNVMMDELAR
jgi:hypothetical protein